MKPICRINGYGDKYWWLGNQLHREDGPACEEIGGTKAWFYYGKLHREDGPAYECVSGYYEWYYHGKQINCKDNQEFLRIVKLMIFL